MRDVELPAGAETYTMRFTFNAICDLEEKTGEKVDKLFAFDQNNTPPMRLVRDLVHASLSHHHPDLSIEEVGNVIDRAGMLQTMEKLAKAIEAAFPQEESAGNAPKGEPQPTG